VAIQSTRRKRIRKAQQAGNGIQHRANRMRAAQRSLHGLDEAMRRPCTYRHPAGRVVRIETHISVVYLAGRFAYKVIKPVAPGFADFTAANTRLRCCEAQVRLNRSLARGLYLGVLPVVRLGRKVALGGPGAPFEHVVRMRRFNEAMLFSRLAEQGKLSFRDVERAAGRLACYHGQAPRRVPRTAYGSAALLRQQIEAVTGSLLANFSHPALHEVSAWCAQQLAKHEADIDRRRAEGFVRACHGDLHLDNLVRWRGRIAMFDCIDFDDALRWIDVANDIAFLAMDLRAHGGDRLASRLLNRWLETSGDYDALSLMPLYSVYRALVRAWVVCLKANSAPQDERASATRGATRYIDFARAVAQRPDPVLLLCHGYSGSGKSVASRALADLCGAVRVSSDTERKRPPRTVRALDGNVSLPYTQEARHAIYARLLGLASDVLQTGYSVIVDATFLERRHRDAFFGLARRLSVPAALLDFRAEKRVLRERIDARKGARPMRPTLIAPPCSCSSRIPTRSQPTKCREPSC